jgi:hypothetical protein
VQRRPNVVPKVDKAKAEKATVEHKVKEAPSKKVMKKKDHHFELSDYTKKEQPKVAKPVQKEDKAHHRPAKLPQVKPHQPKPVHVAPKPMKVQEIVPVVEKPKVLHSKDILDIGDDDDEMDSQIKAQLKKLHDLYDGKGELRKRKEHEKRFYKFVLI